MGEQDSDQAREAKDANEPDEQDNNGSTPTEKPEPDEEDKEKAAEMREAYKERPTLILPGTGGAVSGTAVGEWLDDDGNPKYANDEDAPAAKANSDGDESDDKDIQEQMEKDKEFNKAVLQEARKKEGSEEEAERSDNEKAVST
jgi:hypothetical protein